MTDDGVIEPFIYSNILFIHSFNDYALLYPGTMLGTEDTQFDK